MRIIISLFSVLAIALTASAQEVWTPQEWPSIKTYDQQHLQEIALPLGGIGTGSVSLGGRGELRDWEIMNVPGKGYSTVTTGNNAPFFAIWVSEVGKQPQTKILNGPLYDNEYLHYEGRPVNHYGLPRFTGAEFKAAFPFGQAVLTDSSLPVKVTVKGFNPFIPGDEEMSGLPIAILSYEVENLTFRDMEVSVAGSLRNFIGKDGSKFTTDWKGDYIPIGASKNRNTYKSQGGLSGIVFTSDGVDPSDPAWGNMALTTQAPDSEVTYRTSSKKDDWSNAILNFWDDFSLDGKLSQQSDSGEDDPMASLAVKRTVKAGEKEHFTFFLTWNFPNRKAWASEVVGNYYSQKYPDAWQTAQQIVPQMTSLEQRTLNFVNAIAQTTYPDELKEAALFNLAVFHSQTVFRIKDGHFMGWEGVMDRFGSCQGSCTHVWNYETATPFLFGNLARSMRDVEFNYALKDGGLMNFRAALPLSKAAEGNSAAADGQMGCIMKFYREWQLLGDNAYLRQNWNQVKKALSYAWQKGSWDGDQDGVMEGSQHNTMDVNYFGPNPQMAFWYLGALQAAAKMADAVKDATMAKKCRSLYSSGSKWVEKNLFNGEYYEQKITSPETFQFIDPEKDPVPDYQLYKGCLVDQLVGQYMADLCGLGTLGDRNNKKTTLNSIMKYNFKEDFTNHFNNNRSYALGNEAGLLMASWPKGRLTVPFPYFSEVMTGFEYTAATSMIYEGMKDDAMKVIKAIRARHDGSKRNPFSEPECGHHYARSMASWSALLAWSGFHYSAVDKSLELTSEVGRYFWSNGYSWGTFEITPTIARITVIEGTLNFKKLKVGKRNIEKNASLKAGQVLSSSLR